MYSANGRPGARRPARRQRLHLLNGGGRADQVRLAVQHQRCRRDDRHHQLHVGARVRERRLHLVRPARRCVDHRWRARRRTRSGCSSNSPPIAGRAGVLRAGDRPDDHRPHHHPRRPHVAGTDAPIAGHADRRHPRESADDSNIAVGDRVVYRAPVSVPFTSALVNVTLSTSAMSTAPSSRSRPPTPTAAPPTTRRASNIFVGSTFYDRAEHRRCAHLHPAGRHRRDGTDVRHHLLRHQDRRRLHHPAGRFATARPSAPATRAAPRSSSRWPLTLTGPDSVGHQLDRSLGQLVDGRDYYVTSYNPDNRAITLATTLGGPALILDADPPTR